MIEVQSISFILATGAATAGNLMRGAGRSATVSSRRTDSDLPL